MAMLDLSRFNEVIVSYGMHSLFVKQMLNSWSTCNRIISQDWRDLITAVLEPEMLLHYTNAYNSEKAVYKSENLSKVDGSPYDFVQKSELYVVLTPLMNFM